MINEIISHKNAKHIKVRDVKCNIYSFIGNTFGLRLKYLGLELLKIQNFEITLVFDYV